ncbi:MAG: allantoate deiminase [Solirubrobacteraceae bacterium]|jgi:N-carbamoyl-L-amino-acid hydrolase|nr:allantoate deiminase [Solirubrobacteraceae bacterium]
MGVTDTAGAGALEPARAVADLRALRELTEDERGAQRVAWTDTWARARTWLREQLEPLPVAVDVDEAGNLWAVLRGASERTVLLGGHIDSVPDGGWLDGSLDVLAGLEVLRALAAAGEPPVSVALVDWADEEGARFGRSLLGSGMTAGTVDPADVAELRDHDGVALADALAAHGVDLGAASRSGERLARAAAYLELHIEQGPVLEREGLAVGVVTGTAGVERHAVRIRGQAVQGGAFPMDSRRDALVAAAKLVLAVRDGVPDADSRATVGDVRVRPGIPTAVPGECELVVDQRHPDAATLATMLRELRQAAGRIAAEEGVEIAFTRIWGIDPVPFDERLVDLAEEVAREVTGAGRRLFSGALHDAAEVARAGVPAVMLFVQSLGGLSHTRLEDTRPEDLETAVRALHRLTTRVVERVADGRL